MSADEKTVPDADIVRAETLAWLEHAVIGLNLCPFARAVQARGGVRCVVSPAQDAEALLAQLVEEMQALSAADADAVETTLLVHPHVLQDFQAFNDFLDVADAALEALALDGVLQVASFHPDYCFADTDPQDITNASNRSPWPTLHLLREASIDRALELGADPDAIVERNLHTMTRLGPQGWAALQARCRLQLRVSSPGDEPPEPGAA